MIAVQANTRDFEYDIRSLIKAFYPEQNIKVTVMGEDPPLKKHERADSCSDPLIFTLAVYLEETSVSMSLFYDVIMFQEEYHVFESRDPKEIKNELKTMLYGILSKQSGKKLPWGTLTGIRPTKIPMAMLEEGKNRQEIEDYMERTYHARKDKVSLTVGIAEYELSILKATDSDDGYSIYIGIPFCPSTCLYCSFTSYPISKWENEIESYLEALFKEIDFTAQAFQDRKLNTIYIGGGTPTTLLPHQLEMLMEKLESVFDISALKEFTVEAGRPDSITAEKLQVLKEHRVSRISINPQTMKQETLEIIGRKHTAQETVAAFRMARSLGFDNINMDLIIGLPGEEIADVERTMEAVRELDPDSITVHSLAIKRAARLNMQWENYQDLKFENTEEIINMTAKSAKEMGMAPYYLYRQKNMAGNFENVGYAKPGKEGLYNILIMEERQPIIALGAGASTKIVFRDEDRIERIENVKDVKNYIERIDEMIERKQVFIEHNVF